MEKDALANGILSFIIPGLGHAIHGNTKRGIMLFIGMLIVHAAIYYLANNILGSGSGANARIPKERLVTDVDFLETDYRK